MISLLILLILAWSFYLGHSRGIFLQSYYFLASLVSLLIAASRYKALGTFLSMWVPYANATEGTQVRFYNNVSLFDLDKVYYYGIAFLIVYAVSYVIFRFIGIFLHAVNSDRFHFPWSNSLAGFLAILVTSFSLVMILMILATIPFDAIQNRLASDGLASSLIKHFPVLSAYLQQLWTV